MEKNWLIRTKNQHILGPVSKNKVKELFENGSIKGDDEICSGNGYWFFVREKDLVDKYLVGEIPQGFNPVCEGLTVLDISSMSLDLDDDTVLPSDDDLKYPDLEALSVEDPIIIKTPEPNPVIEENDTQEIDNVTSLHAPVVMDESEISLPNESDLEYPDMEGTIELESEEYEEEEEFEEEFEESSNQDLAQKSFLSGNIIYILALLFLLLAISGFYFRHKIIGYINASVSIVLPSAHAQTSENLLLKKKLKITLK